MYRLTAGLAFFSGATGLIYEICWVRLLGYSVGSDSSAISIVLSAFFLGIALGSLFLAHYSKRNNLSIRHYISLEIFIGLSGILILSLITRLDLLIAAYPVIGSTLIGKFFASQLLLFIPTVCLGATFPLLAALLIRSQEKLGLRISQLYTFNILGAVLGALAVGFILIPEVGLDGSIYVAAAINFSIALIAWLNRHKFSIVKAEPAIKHIVENSASIKSSNKNTQYSLIAKCSLALSGFSLIAYEIAWTKYFSIVTGSSLYSFSIILAVTLFGIAVGSWLIRHHLGQVKNLTNWLIGILLMLSILLLLQKQMLSQIPALMNDINYMNSPDALRQLYRYGLVFIFIFPATLLFGLLFPVALRLYTESVQEVKLKISYAFAINTLASIISSILVGFWIIPVFGTDNLLRTIIILLPIFAITYYYLLPIHQKLHKNREKIIVVTGITLIFLSIFSKPVDFRSLTEANNEFYNQAIKTNTPVKYFYSAEGKHSFVSLISYDNKYALLNSNGLQESMISLSDKEFPLAFETLQAYIPYFFQQESDNAFVIGYGGGNTTQALLDTPVKRVDIVEIEPEIVNAVKQIRHGPAKALNDNRVNLVIGDARTQLLTSTKQYNIITSQPSHPWLSGSANILTKEFFSLAKSKLKANGIMTQWIALFRMDTTALKSILKAFYSEFPHGFTLAHKETGDMMLVGARSPLNFNRSEILKKMQQSSIAKRLLKLRLREPEDLLWFYQLSRRDIMQSVEDVPANSDMNIISEIRLAARYRNGTNEEDPLLYLSSLATMDVSPMLSDDIARTVLFQAGTKFIDWGSEAKAQLIIKQLEKIDSMWADSLQHELLYWKSDFQAATNLYTQQKKWLDITHYRQFEIAIEHEQNNLFEFMDKVISPPLKQLMHTQILYANKDWQNIVKIQPMDIQTQRWRLAGLINDGSNRAIDQLAAITPANYKNIKFLKILEKAFKERNELGKSQWMTKQLQTLFKLKIQFYQYMLKNALSEKNNAWKVSLEHKILELGISLKSVVGENQDLEEPSLSDNRMSEGGFSF